MKSREKRQGVMLVHTGEGKGKSSSAFGVVFRAAGWGMKVCVIQFIKSRLFEIASETTRYEIINS